MKQVSKLFCWRVQVKGVYWLSLHKSENTTSINFSSCLQEQMFYKSGCGWNMNSPLCTNLQITARNQTGESESCWGKTHFTYFRQKIVKMEAVVFCFSHIWCLFSCGRAHAAASDANAFSFAATVKISSLKGLKRHFWTFGDLDHSGRSVWNHFIFSFCVFSILNQVCSSSVLLWSSRTVLWTSTLHLTSYHQEEQRRMDSHLLVNSSLSKSKYNTNQSETRRVQPRWRILASANFWPCGVVFWNKVLDRCRRPAASGCRKASTSEPSDRQR